MSLLRTLSDGLRSLFRKKQASQELDEELRGFLEMAAEEKIMQGMSCRDALRAVRLERGNLEVTKEVVRSSGWESFLETCWRDLRVGTRNATQVARIHGCRRSDARSGHRNELCDFQCC